MIRWPYGAAFLAAATLSWALHVSGARAADLDSLFERAEVLAEKVSGTSTPGSVGPGAGADQGGQPAPPPAPASLPPSGPPSTANGPEPVACHAQLAEIDEKVGVFSDRLPEIEERILLVNRELEDLRVASIDPDNALGCSDDMKESIASLKEVAAGFATEEATGEAETLLICASEKVDVIARDQEAAQQDGNVSLASRLGVVHKKATDIRSRATDVAQVFESFASKEARLRQGIAEHEERCTDIVY